MRQSLEHILIIIVLSTIFCLVLGETKAVQVVNVPDEEAYYFTLESVDIETQTFYVRLGAPLMNGSDGSCQYAGVIMNEILEENPEWVIFITNEGWVPTKHNPVNLEWSRVLAQGY